MPADMTSAIADQLHRHRRGAVAKAVITGTRPSNLRQAGGINVS